jgi:hypothetical protein
VAVFDPLRNFGYSTAISFLATFLVSGIFHTHLTWMTFGEGYSGLSFFVLNGILCTLEHKYIQQLALPHLVGWLWTCAALSLSAAAWALNNLYLT